MEWKKEKERVLTMAQDEGLEEYEGRRHARKFTNRRAG